MYLNESAYACEPPSIAEYPFAEQQRMVRNLNRAFVQAFSDRKGWRTPTRQEADALADTMRCARHEEIKFRRSGRSIWIDLVAVHRPVIQVDSIGRAYVVSIQPDGQHRVSGYAYRIRQGRL